MILLYLKQSDLLPDEEDGLSFYFKFFIKFVKTSSINI